MLQVKQSDVFSTSDLLLFSNNMRSSCLSGWLSFVVCILCKSIDEHERNVVNVVQVASCRALTGKVSVLEAREVAAAVAQDLVARRGQVPLVDRRVTTSGTTMEVAFVNLGMTLLVYLRKRNGGPTVLVVRVAVSRAMR